MKRYIGNGQYCYTINCKRHAQVFRLIKNYNAHHQPSLIEKVSEIVYLVDRDHAVLSDYYEGTEKKHFHDPQVAGSKFTDSSIKSIEDLLLLASYQRGDLKGDDRGAFLAAGTASEALNDNSRYLMVKTPGKLGVVESTFISPETKVLVKRTKPLAPCSYVMQVKEQPTIGYGVIIISQYLGKERFITAFPGPPTRVSTSRKTLNEVNSLEGQEFTIRELENKLRHPFTVHTQIV